MSNSGSDNTLNIQPHSPGSLPTWDKSSTPSNYPEAADEARLKIEELNRPAYQGSVPNKLSGTTLPNPVSPTQESLRVLPKLSDRKYSKAKPILSALASFLFILMLFKAPILLSQIQYLLAGQNPPQPVLTNASAEAVPPNPIITIPKINVSAPVVYEPSIVEAKIQQSLQSGVVHYGTTPAPGQPGNSVIVGHSSNDWWEPGNFKFVFVLLDKLVPGDTLSLNYNSKRYIYEVTESKVVEATDLSVLAPTSSPTLTLITCWPAGTSLKREIIKAKQISPAPQASTTVTAQPTTTSTGILPGNAPSFWQEIQQFWQGVKDGVSNKPTTVTAPTPTQPTGTTPSQSGGSLPGGL